MGFPSLRIFIIPVGSLKDHYSRIRAAKAARIREPPAEGYEAADWAHATLEARGNVRSFSSHFGERGDVADFDPQGFSEASSPAGNAIPSITIYNNNDPNMWPQTMENTNTPKLPNC